MEIESDKLRLERIPVERLVSLVETDLETHKKFIQENYVIITSNHKLVSLYLNAIDEKISDSKAQVQLQNRLYSNVTENVINNLVDILDLTIKSLNILHHNTPDKNLYASTIELRDLSDSEKNILNIIPMILRDRNKLGVYTNIFKFKVEQQEQSEEQSEEQLQEQNIQIEES